MSSPDRLTVAVDLDGVTVDAATVYFNRRGSGLTTTVQYLPGYLANHRAYALDPALQLMAVGQSVRGLPGAFDDSAPDRWGKNLIEKRIRAEAQRESRHAAAVTPVDLLLGVADRTRQGALRFRAEPDEKFLHPDTTVPPLVELPRLLRASDHVTYGPNATRSDLSAIKDLLDAGTGTLGGARPKASVLAGDRLLIAKFPKPNDNTDVMAWECTALDLAEEAGVQVPRHRAVQVDGRTVLLLDRFDRTQDRRVGYVSAMTLVGSRDGDVSDYLDIQAAVADHSSNPNQDLAVVWRRMAFSVAIHNTDDHLRNHGFLRRNSGWTASPAFDVSPNPDIAEERVTGISGARGQADEVDALVLCSPEFGLDNRAAGTILTEVFDATAQWRDVAAKNGITDREIRLFTLVRILARAGKAAAGKLTRPGAVQSGRRSTGGSSLARPLPSPPEPRSSPTNRTRRKAR